MTGWSQCTSSSASPYRTSCNNGYSSCSNGGWYSTSNCGRNSGSNAFASQCSGTYAYMQQTMSLTVGLTYTVGFYVKLASSGSSWSLNIGVDGTNYISQATNDGWANTNNFQYKSFSFIAASTSQVLYFSSNGGSSRCKFSFRASDCSPSCDFFVLQL